MDTASVFFASMQAIFWVLSLFFIPGFVITLVLFPRLMEIGTIRRSVYSVILSIIFVLVIVLFMGVVFGLGPTPGNIGPVISVFLVLMLIIWLFEVFFPGSRFQESIAPRLFRSKGYQAIRKNFSRQLHAALDRRKAATTLVVFHESQRSGRNHINHSYLLNVGREIDIQQIIEYKGKTSGSVLPPPDPKTRYVELTVREYNDGMESLVDDLRVYPVHVTRNLNRTVLGFKPKRGNLDISERIYTKTTVTEVQWIYSNDFHLFAIAHPDDTLDQMVDRIIAKIDQIVTSLQYGTRVTPHTEDQKLRRDAYDAVIGKPKPATPAPVRTAESRRRPQIIFDPDERDRRSMQKEILSDLDMYDIMPASLHNTDRLIEKIFIPKEADINKQVLARIEEILDDDWLYT
ncbi:MAG: hypothetical protein ABSE07_06890 [Methanoregula sp.]